MQEQQERVAALTKPPPPAPAGPLETGTNAGVSGSASGAKAGGIKRTFTIMLSVLMIAIGIGAAGLAARPEAREALSAAAHARMHCVPSVVTVMTECTTDAMSCAAVVHGMRVLPMLAAAAVGALVLSVAFSSRLGFNGAVLYCAFLTSVLALGLLYAGYGYVPGCLPAGIPKCVVSDLRAQYAALPEYPGVLLHPTTAEPPPAAAPVPAVPVADAPLEHVQTPPEPAEGMLRTDSSPDAIVDTDAGRAGAVVNADAPTPLDGAEADPVESNSASDGAVESAAQQPDEAAKVGVDLEASGSEDSGVAPDADAIVPDAVDEVEAERLEEERLAAAQAEADARAIEAVKAKSAQKRQAEQAAAAEAAAATAAAAEQERLEAEAAAVKVTEEAADEEKRIAREAEEAELERTAAATEAAEAAAAVEDGLEEHGAAVEAGDAIEEVGLEEDGGAGKAGEAVAAAEECFEEGGAAAEADETAAASS